MRSLKAKNTFLYFTFDSCFKSLAESLKSGREDLDFFTFYNRKMYGSTGMNNNSLASCVWCVRVWEEPGKAREGICLSGFGENVHRRREPLPLWVWLVS